MGADDEAGDAGTMMMDLSSPPRSASRLKSWKWKGGEADFGEPFLFDVFETRRAGDAEADQEDVRLRVR